MSVSLDRAGAVLGLTQGAAALLGISAAEAVGRQVSELLGPALADELERARHRGDFETERLLPTAHGQRRLKLHVCRWLGASGEASGFSLVLQETAETHKSVNELLLGSELNEQLLGLVSHDLKNPLQAVALLTALALRQESPPTIRRYLERIKGSTERSVQMIQDLLDFARLRKTGSLPIEPAHGSLLPLLEEEVAHAHKVRPERHIDFSSEGDLSATFDAPAIRQVVRHLIGNALVHTTEDVAIAVAARDTGDGLELTVHDEGPQLSTDVKARLFSPFMSGTGTAGGGGRSIGLGLTIAKAAVHAHGGSIDVTSTAPTGTTFTVRLPRTVRRTSERDA